MYLSDWEYRELMNRIEQLEAQVVTSQNLDALLQAHVFGCSTEDEQIALIGEYADDDGFIAPELFVDIACHSVDELVWRPDAPESISLAEYTGFLQTWLKVIDNEDWLDSILTLGAVLMRKEGKAMTADLKQVRDIRAKLHERAEQLAEFV